MPFVIATYGTRDGKHVRNVDPKLYRTRRGAEDEIDDRKEIGDEAARQGRMKIEVATFGDCLHALREKAGLSVDDLARACGLSRQVLYRYEAGERKPGWGAVQAIASALDCTTDALRCNLKE